MLERMLYLLIGVGVCCAWAMLTILGSERVRLIQESDAKMHSDGNNAKT
jgi:hypothetical protein